MSSHNNIRLSNKKGYKRMPYKHINNTKSLTEQSNIIS